MTITWDESIPWDSAVTWDGAGEGGETAVRPAVAILVDFGGSIGEVDLAGFWDAASGLEITQGRPGVGQDVTPGTLSLQFTNDDGQFTPDNPASAYWPRVIAGIPIAVTMTIGGDSRTLFAGTITDWQPEYPDGDLSRAFVRVSAVDALAVLARKTLRHLIHERAMVPLPTSEPLHYWPLDEPPGADGADNMVGGESLFVRQYGTGGSLTFEDAEIATVPPVKCAEFTRAGTADGKYLRGTATGGSATATAFTVLCWVEQTASVSGVMGVWQVTLGDGATLSLVLNANEPQAEFVSADGLSVMSTPLAFSILELNTPSLIAVSVYESSGTWYLTLNALSGYLNEQTDSTAVDPGPFDLSSVTVRVGIAGAVTGSTMATSLRVAGLGINDSATSWDPLDLWQKGLSTPQQIAGYDTTVSRAKLLCERAGLYVSSLPSDSGDAVGPQDLAGLTALDAMIDLYRHRGAYIQATHDAGALDVRAAGSTRPVTASLTVHVEDDGVGSPTFSRADFDTVSVVTVAGLSGRTTYRDVGLVADIGVVADEVETPLLSWSDRYYAAQDRVALGKWTKLRPQRFTFDLHSAVSNLYPDWLGGDAHRIGSRIRLTGLPASHFGYTSIDGYLEGYTERLSLSGHEITVDLSSADPVAGVFDTHRFGWGEGVCTLAANVAADDTSITLTWAGAESLSVSAGDYPLDLNLDGERVRIPTAAGSPTRTVAVIRGVEGTVARAHAAGAPVEVWDVDRFAY